jgi:flagellar assembly protein FliH
MRWFEEEGEAARAVNFRDVSHRNRPDLSWARKGKASVRPGADGVSLRPPRVPSELRVPSPKPEAVPESCVGATLAREEEEAMSGLHPAPALKEAMAEPVPPDVQDFQAFSVPPSERRKDTMIDDIVPRAEEEAVAAIQKAVAQMAEGRADQFEALEQRLVDLAMVVARRVIAREVTLDRTIVQALVREGVSALGERDRVTVRVGMFFADMKDHLEAQLSGAKIQCDVVVDSSLSKSGCVVETDLGKVDESIETRLANMIETLSFESRRKRK